MFSRLLASAVGAAMIASSSAEAQCPDGTPPPCDVRVAEVAQRRAAPSSDQRGRSFLVLPFRNVTRSQEHDWLVEGATTLLSDALGRWEEISVVPEERLYPALRRHNLEPGQVMDEQGVRRVAEETGGWTAVTGDILAPGSQVRLSARAYDVVSNEVVVRVTENAEGEEDILPAFERLAGHLLATAGLNASDAGLAGTTTQSLDAYRAYIRGLGHYYRNEARQAREAFQEAVRLDSTFAQAHLKLAESLMTTLEAFTDPQSAGYRHAERAAALSQRLPPRDREFVQALTALFRGQVGAARAGLEHILVSDSNDLEALENLADIEQMDPVLVQMPAGEFPRGSLNEAARLSKRALALDPGRHQNYEKLTRVYLLAAGEGHGRVVGIRGEPPSLLGLFQAMVVNPARLYVAVLRDTIELLPVDSLDVMEPDSLQAARARAAAVAAAWVAQWVAATPDAAAANLAASQAYTRAGQYRVALRHLAIADSLGLEIEYLQNVAGRRVQILMQAGEYEEATALSDSLLATGYIDVADAATKVIRQQDLTWFYNLYLFRGRVVSADSLAAALLALTRQGAPQASLQQVTQSVVGLLNARTDARVPQSIPGVPERLRFAAVDSLTAHLAELPSHGVLEDNLGTVYALSVLNALPRVKLERLRRWRAEAERLLADREGRLAFGLVMPSVNDDTTAAGREETFALLGRITELHPEAWEAHYQLGKLGAVSGMYLDEAEAALRRYLEHEPTGMEPGKPSALWRLGLVLEHRGDVQGARASYEEALRLDPQHAESREALRRLEGEGDRG